MNIRELISRIYEKQKRINWNRRLIKEFESEGIDSLKLKSEIIYFEGEIKELQRELNSKYLPV
jgi:hypothetical protein